MTLSATVERLRRRLIEYRFSNRFNTKIHTQINIIETALNLAEMGIDKNRTIQENEEHWFNESWDVIHILEKTEWEDILDLYRNMGFKLKERNWFR